MAAGIAAQAVLLIHLLFILFVLCGGLLALRWPRLAWLHLPALLWAVTVEWTGWMCPLTPLENALRHAAGGQSYQGGFIEYYIWPLIYPADLTREMQFMLGSFVLLLNAPVYGVLYRRRRG